MCRLWMGYANPFVTFYPASTPFVDGVVLLWPTEQQFRTTRTEHVIHTDMWIYLIHNKFLITLTREMNSVECST